MSHIAELSMIFTDKAALEKALIALHANIKRDVRMDTQYSSQHFATARDTLEIVAVVEGGEQLGFRRRDLTEEERTGLVDSSESKMAAKAPAKGLIPVGDMYYGGLTRAFGNNLCKLQAHYHAELIRKSLGRNTKINITEEKDQVVVHAVVN